MQVYGFKCPKCGEQYETNRMSFSDYEKMMEENPPECTECSTKLVRSYSPQLRWNCAGGTRGKILS